ncbi:hypothetical protein [Agaribacter marinus]|uniref:Lipoprotein n=1 Tax=Agaribacter marinus TaxID=1431249 RepID=A0AA37T0E3_9ALTE|nr:hypothetical protein [Agaribacter marinus]GLR71574.1 hypothetical protein GCM10007852_24820 [Agaribacter marinus]
MSNLHHKYRLQALCIIVLTFTLFACDDTTTTRQDTPIPKEDIHMSGIPLPNDNGQSSAPSIATKRAAPPDVPSLKFEGMTYLLTTKTNEELTSSSTTLNALDQQQTLSWSLELYKIAFDPLIETDVQEIYPASMEVDEVQRRLTITDEQSNKYVVDLDTHSLITD